MAKAISTTTAHQKASRTSIVLKAPAPVQAADVLRWVIAEVVAHVAVDVGGQVDAAGVVVAIAVLAGKFSKVR